MKRFARFAKYFVAGGIAALFDIGLFQAFISMGVAYQIAALASFLVATLVNYFLSTHYVFPDRKGGAKLQKIIGTYAVSAVGLLLNQIVLWIGIEKYHMLPFIAKLVATGLVFFWNYFIRNYYVFKRHP